MDINNNTEQAIITQLIIIIWSYFPNMAQGEVITRYV